MESNNETVLLELVSAVKKIEQFQGTQRRPRQFCHGEQGKTADSGKQGQVTKDLQAR